ncbi:MAG TPA: sigma-54 dependent transcriptional regulator [Opitutaceae bacterium]|nr:sigma-54 dependent transcriptional regulator [Opitutaceae bacterium]
MKILVLGDDSKNRRLLSFGLAGEGDEAATVASTSELQRFARLKSFEVAILDWEMRGEPAKEVLSCLRRLAPCLPVVVMSTTGERGAQAKNHGAVEVLLKPIEIENARLILARQARTENKGDSATTPELSEAAEPSAVKSEKPAGAAAPLPPARDPELPLSRNPAVLHLASMAARVAPTPASVLLLGENGTGKTRLARSIHEQSQRRSHPFVTVNCPCLQPQLLESELFGHVRGSFTGAVNDTLGKVAAAEGGTLFLDEIGELPLSVQPKLLRLLQDRCYERVGETRSRSADIRVIAATNRDLKAEVAAGRFREDLFYRLNVISLVVPSLRQRSEDILPSAEFFLKSLGASMGRQFRGFTPLARSALQAHPWPGNIRELRNTIERAAILCEKDVVDIGDLPELTQSSVECVPQVGEFVTVEELVEAHIQQVLARTDSFGHAARILGIDKATLYRRRKRAENRITPFDDDELNVAVAS